MEGKLFFGCFDLKSTSCTDTSVLELGFLPKIFNRHLVLKPEAARTSVKVAEEDEHDKDDKPVNKRLKMTKGSRPAIGSSPPL